MSYGLELSPREHYSISIAPDYSWNYDESQWILTYENATADNAAIYGALTSQTISIGIRSNYSFTPDMSLQLFVQPFLAIGNFEKYGGLDSSKTYPFYGSNNHPDLLLSKEEALDYGIDEDFNKKSLAWQSVFRWEYRPGSVFFLVWSFSSADNESLPGEFDIPGSFKNLFDQVATHKFLIKYNYWMKL